MKYRTPIGALTLAEDMKGLDLAKALIRDLRVESLGENRDEVFKEIWSLNQLLIKWGNYAQGRLRQEFLKA